MAGRQIAKKKPRRSGASSQGSHGDLEPSGWPIGGRAYVAQSAAADHPTDSRTLPRWPVASIDLDQTEEDPVLKGENGRGLQFSAGCRGGGAINRIGSVDLAPY